MEESPMGQFVTRLRNAALFMLIVTGSASLAAAGQAGGQNMSKTPEQVRRELVALMDALPSLHPNNAGLARRVAAVKEKLAALTAEQLAAVTPAFSDTEFTAAVGRLSAAAQVTAFALQAPLPGAEYDSCGSTRSDTDSGRDLTISADALNIAAIIGDVACNSIVVILGEGSNLPACIIAGVLHEAVQAVNFERDLRNYCDGVINGNEIRGILNNSTVIGSNLASHDADIKAALAQHDADIKALLAIVQQSVDEANQRLKVSEALERQALKLLLTPEGLRSVDPAVMTCTGDNCPKLVICPGPECSFAIIKK
jgi:hypothetical protein